jgi:hypothetical protein
VLSALPSALLHHVGGAAFWCLPVRERSPRGALCCPRSHIDFSFSRSSGRTIFPSSLGSLPNLRYLDLSYSEFGYTAFNFSNPDHSFPLANATWLTRLEYVACGACLATFSPRGTD